MYFLINFTSTCSEYNGYHIFVWIYGVSHGGYVYAFKMYIFEKVRARNFARAWGFAQMAMAIPTLVGIPAASEYVCGRGRKGVC